MSKLTFLKEIKEKIRPDEKFFKIVNEFLDNLNKLIQEAGVDAIAVIGGSVAKKTMIRNDHDADLFVRFNYEKYKDEDLSNILEKVIAQLKPVRVHGSRDYFQVKKKTVFEIVPVLNIEDYTKAVNVTDMSPLHVDYVKSHTNNKTLDEIRLLKQFCKANDIYGAESYIGGFSGHIIDLITIYYGSFLNVLKSSQEWEDKVVIDIENHLDDPFNDLNSAKTTCPMIIVDPVQPDRNAAAALNEEKFELFKLKAKEFLKNPSEDFFKKKKFNIENIKKSTSEKIMIFYITPLDGKRDIVGAKLLKVYLHILRETKDAGFNIIESGWNWDNGCVLYYIIKNEKLSDELEKRGPPVDSIVDAAKFKNKHESITIRNGRMYSQIKREIKTPLQMANLMIKEDFIKERVKKIKKEVN